MKLKNAQNSFDIVVKGPCFRCTFAVFHNVVLSWWLPKLGCGWALNDITKNQLSPEGSSNLMAERILLILFSTFNQRL